MLDFIPNMVYNNNVRRGNLNDTNKKGSKTMAKKKKKKQKKGNHEMSLRKIIVVAETMRLIREIFELLEILEKHLDRLLE